MFELFCAGAALMAGVESIGRPVGRRMGTLTDCALDFVETGVIRLGEKTGMLKVGAVPVPAVRHQAKRVQQELAHKVATLLLNTLNGQYAGFFDELSAGIQIAANQAAQAAQTNAAVAGTGTP